MACIRRSLGIIRLYGSQTLGQEPGENYENHHCLGMSTPLTLVRIWLLDLSSQLDASAELVGLDNDITQVGPREWLPLNMKLREWNVFSDPPDDLVGKFDIVHIRLFIFVIEDDPTLVLRRLIKLLSMYPPFHKVDFGYILWQKQH